jgi:hypothetical protein
MIALLVDPTQLGLLGSFKIQVNRRPGAADDPAVFVD